MQTFEEYLEEIFMDDWSHYFINKDNCEGLFSSWLEKKDVNDIMEYAEKWNEKIISNFKKSISKDIEELSKILSR